MLTDTSCSARDIDTSVTLVILLLLVDLGISTWVSIAAIVTLKYAIVYPLIALI